MGKRSIEAIQKRISVILKWRATNHTHTNMLRPYSLTPFTDKNDNEAAFWCCSCSIPSTLSVDNIILCDHCGIVWSHWDCLGLNLNNIDLRTYYHICYECKSKLSQRTEWTSEIDAILIQSINAGMKNDEIARKLIRSTDSIRDRINTLNTKHEKNKEYEQCFLSEQEINDLVVGNKCDLMDYQGRFLPVQIKKKKVLKMQVHFIGYSKKYDLWINIEEKEKFAKYSSISTLQSAQYKHIKIGDRCNALIDNQWIQCKVIGFDEHAKKRKSDQMLVEDVKNKNIKRWFHPCSESIHFPHCMTKKRMNPDSNIRMEQNAKRRRLN